MCGRCAFAFLHTIAGVAFVTPTLSTTSMYTSTRTRTIFFFFAKPGRKTSRRLRSILVGGSASTPSWMQTAKRRRVLCSQRGYRPRALLASLNPKIEMQFTLVSKTMSSYLCLLLIGLGCPTSGMVDIYRHGDLGFPCWRVPAVVLAERYVPRCPQRWCFLPHTCRDNALVVLDR